MAVIGPGILTGSMLNGLHKPLWSSAFRILHVSVLVLLAWIGREVMGYVGMLWGIVAGDVIVAAVGIVVGWKILSRVERDYVPPEQPEPTPPVLPGDQPEATAAWD